MVVPSIGLAYARVPKVANSMLKRQLARAGGIERLFAETGFSKDRSWREAGPHAYVVSAEELSRRWPDAYVFTFVREPLSRLASCYRSKVERKGRTGAAAEKELEGMGRGTPFAAFVEHVARRPDRRANIHYRAQADILAPAGDVTADFVGRFETLGEDWDRLSQIVTARLGLRLPPLPPRKRPLPIVNPDDYFGGDERLLALAKRRYADDYRLFYPDRI
ncbi:MAG: sulfotransferase family 2 domain-containing protein [Pseudomonadota bacterium]